MDKKHYKRTVVTAAKMAFVPFNVVPFTRTSARVGLPGPPSDVKLDWREFRKPHRKRGKRGGRRHRRTE